MLLKLLEVLTICIVVAGAFTEIFYPLVRSYPLFPSFNKRFKKYKEKKNEALEKRFERVMKEEIVKINKR